MDRFVLQMKSETWLLLLYALPTKRSSARVSLWRKLNKFGAVQLKTSAYLLPDQPANYERFQWLARQIQDEGGEATLIRVVEIEGLPNARIVQLFNNARAHDYKALIKSLQPVINAAGRSKRKEPPADSEKFHRQFVQIKQVDYFNCPIAHEAQMSLEKVDRLLRGKGAHKSKPALQVRNFQGKTWLTRPRPEVDRVGSAWLIRRFIDHKARFVFANETSAFPK